jgi:hypothetical protein
MRFPEKVKHQRGCCPRVDSSAAMASAFKGMPSTPSGPTRPAATGQGNREVSPKTSIGVGATSVYEYSSLNLDRRYRPNRRSAQGETFSESGHDRASPPAVIPYRYGAS